MKELVEKVAAGLYCSPEVNYTMQTYQVEGRSVLVVQIEESDRKGFGYLAGVGYFELEILLLVLSFGYESVYIFGVSKRFHACKSR